MIRTLDYHAEDLGSNPTPDKLAKSIHLFNNPTKTTTTTSSSSATGGIISCVYPFHQQAGTIEPFKLATHIHPTEPLAAAHHGTMSIPNPAGQIEGALAAPKYGTLIPNRVFVGGISGDTTEAELCRLFSSYGNVKSTKIIVDRAGVSKGYGFVTFETEHEAQRLQSDTICATNGAVYYAATPPTPTINNIPIEQFATAVYPPGVPTIYPPTMTPYQPFYQYYSVPMNVPTIWPQNYQGM
ncbi:hypothetical protein RP20_CCG003839 [Aedes albopictus]|nr:hypothetical protein RP20_CCG003839 [Aedes albopictus]